MHFQISANPPVPEGAIHHCGGVLTVFHDSSAGSRLQVNTSVRHPSHTPFLDSPTHSFSCSFSSLEYLRLYTNITCIEPAVCSFSTHQKGGRLKFLSIRNMTSRHKYKITCINPFNHTCLHRRGQERRSLSRLKLKLELE